MTVTFIANDPLAGSASGSAAKAITPSADRPVGRSGIAVADLPAESEYAVGSAEFVSWQAREAVLRAVAAFEEAFGPLPGWQGQEANRTLQVVPIAGHDLNAYYDRATISLFDNPVAGATVHAGASTDVASHETGHAILDAIRPELFGVNMMEVAAFHEGFGDCIAILTALSDASIRQELLAGAASLRVENFVESVAEQLSDAVRQVIGPNHNAAKPRHALNTFQWAFPSSLPMNGSPGTLINEAHSLGQLASGVFYDLLCAIFALGDQTELRLWDAAKAAILLCAKAAQRAPIKPRFFESWGRTMLLIDRDEEGGAYHEQIGKAFSGHGIVVTAANFLSPRLRLKAGPRRPTGSEAARSVATLGTRREVRAALGLGNMAPLEARTFKFGNRAIIEVAGTRNVDLTGVAARLANVQSPVPQAVLLGEVDRGTAMLGAIDTGYTYDAEVREFAATLVARDAIDFGGRKKAASRVGSGFLAVPGAITHRVTNQRGKLMLNRVAFACGCRRQPIC